MTPDLRWRFMLLQALLLVVFSFCAGFLFWAAGYTHSSVQTQLAAQSISFPPAGSPAISAAALTPCGSLAAGAPCPIATGPSVGAANSAAMTRYAGQIMTTGAQAQVYANSFIQVHLSDMGYTYSGISELALLHPTNTTYQTIDATIFKGTTLRGMLLNAYGWWTVGTYTGFAAIGVTLAAIAVLFALVFEFLAAYRSETGPKRALSRRSQPRAVSAVSSS